MPSNSCDVWFNFALVVGPELLVSLYHVEKLLSARFPILMVIRIKGFSEGSLRLAASDGSKAEEAVAAFKRAAAPEGLVAVTILCAKSL